LERIRKKTLKKKHGLLYFMRGLKCWRGNTSFVPIKNSHANITKSDERFHLKDENLIDFDVWILVLHLGDEARQSFRKKRIHVDLVEDHGLSRAPFSYKGRFGNMNSCWLFKVHLTVTDAHSFLVIKKEGHSRYQTIKVWLINIYFVFHNDWTMKKKKKKNIFRNGFGIV
jgi:hypothetical protein